MPVKHDTRGRDEYNKKIAEDAARTSIPQSELYTDGFMKAHTKFDTFDAMLKTSNFEALSSAAWDAFVAEHTKFANWQEMVHTANAERVKRVPNS